MNSFFRYPGGKARLYRQIAAYIKPLLNNGQIEYREPFFGGGSVGLSILQEYAPKQMWINDRDLGISSLWSDIINNPQELIQKIHNFTPSVEVFEKYKNNLLTGTSKDLGFEKLVVHQLSYSGLGTMSGGPLGGKNQSSEYKIGCRWSPAHLNSKINKLHKLFLNTSLRGHKCFSEDFRTLLEEDDTKSFIYLDPPYYEKGSQLYQVKFHQQDHEDLANILRKSSSGWVLSYDNNSDIRKLYSWAKIVEVPVKYTITGVVDKVELIIIK